MISADYTMLSVITHKLSADNTLLTANNTMLPADSTMLPADNSMMSADDTMLSADNTMLFLYSIKIISKHFNNYIILWSLVIVHGDTKKAKK
jgi:hypothetical protein